MVYTVYSTVQCIHSVGESSEMVKLRMLHGYNRSIRIKSAQDWPAEYSWSISAFIRVVSVFVPQGRLLWAWNSYEQTPQSLVDLFWVCQLYNWWVHMWLYIQLYSMCTPLPCIVCTVAILRVEFKLHLQATSLIPRVMLPSPVRGLRVWTETMVGMSIKIPHTINHCLCNYKQANI